MKNSIFLYIDYQSNIMGMDNNILSLAQTKTRSISSNSHIHSHNSILIDIAEVSCTDTARRSRGRRGGSGSRGKGKSSGGSSSGGRRGSKGGGSKGGGSRGGRGSGRSSGSAGSSGGRSGSSGSRSGGSSSGSKSTSTSSGPSSSPSGQASARATRSTTTTSQPSSTLSGPVGYASTYSAMGMSPTSNGSSKVLSTQSSYTGPERTKYDQTQSFKTSEGKDMFIKFKGQQVDPNSERGKQISAILQAQRDRKVVNQERKKYISAIKSAKTSGEAIAIQQQARIQNPNIMIEQTNLKADGTKTVLPAGDISGEIKNLDYTKRDSITGQFRETKQSTVLGKPKSVTVTGTSKESDWTFLGSKTDLVTGDVKATPTTMGIASQPSSTISQIGIMPSQTVTKKYDLSEFMTDDQKAFDFMPDVPKGDTADDRAYSGVVKGASNTMAGVWNIGTMFQDYVLGRDSSTLDYKGFYATPVTALETGVVEGAVGTIYSKGQFGLDTGAFQRETSEGIGQAGQLFSDRPVESITSTLVEGVPYAIGSGVKGGIKFLGNLGKTIIKGSDTASTTGKTTGSTGSGFGFDFGSIGKTTPTKFSKADQNKIKMYSHPDRPTGSTEMFVRIDKKLKTGQPNGELTSILAKQNKILSGKATTPSTPNIPIRQSMPNSNVLNLTAKNIIAKQGGDVLGSQALTKVSKIDNLVTTTKKPKGTDVGNLGKMDIDILKSKKGGLKLPDSSLPVKKTPSGLQVKKTVDTSVPMKTNFGVPKYDPSGPRKPDPVKNPPKIFGGIMPFGSGMGGGGSGSGVGKINRYGKKSFTAWDVSTDSISMKGDTYVTSSHAGVLDTKFSNTAKKKKKGSLFELDTTFNM